MGTGRGWSHCLLAISIDLLGITTLTYLEVLDSPQNSFWLQQSLFSWIAPSITQRIIAIRSCLTLCYPMDCSTPGLSIPSPSPGACSNSCPLSWWCHPTISSSVILFSCLQSFPASGSFPMSQLFAFGGQSTGVSASASVLPMNIQDWFPLRLTGWISL